MMNKIDSKDRGLVIGDVYIDPTWVEPTTCNDDLHQVRGMANFVKWWELVLIIGLSLFISHMLLV